MDTTLLKKGSPQELMELIRRLFLEINTAIPGEIISFNKLKQTATVKPCIRGTTITQQGIPVYIELPGIIEVPCLFPYSTTSGFSLTFPINPKDQCLLIFCQRSFDNWLVSGSVQNPSETKKPRSHQYSDAIAIVGLIPNVNAISEFQTDGIEIRNKDRNSYVKVSNTEIIIHEGGNHVSMLTDGSVTAKHGSTVITITSDGKLTFEAPSQFNVTSAKSSFTGNIDATSFSVSEQAGATGTLGSLEFVNGICVKV